MRRDIPIYFSEDELYLLLVSVNHYMSNLEESYKRSQRFYIGYADEHRRENSQRNMAYTMVRMYHLDSLKSRLLSHCPLRRDDL